MNTKANRLQQGDTVGIVDLSSPLKTELLPDAISFLEGLGLKVKIGESVGANDRGYLAGTDEERLKDFHDMIQDPSVKAIFCVRGGYGAARIVDKIDFQLLKENPKIFWGFSDITYLHIAILEYAELVPFHGPMVATSVEKFDELSKKMFLQLFTPMEIQYDERISKLETVVGGMVRGQLIGGNVNRIVSTLGTKFEIDVRGKILLLEDIGEDLPHLDGLFNQLRLARKLEEAAGFVLGSFTYKGEELEQEALSLLVNDYFGGLGKPTVSGFKIGHCTPNIAVPLGVDAILDGDAKVLRILPGVE